jgi:hypothetical protein
MRVEVAPGLFCSPVNTMDMLKKLNNVHDLRQLVIGDHLLDHPEESKARRFIIENISGTNIYAVYDNGWRELKILPIDALPEADWWVVPGLKVSL